MTLEALNLQLDNLKREIQALKVENAKLREGNPSFGTVDMVDQGEMDELRQDLQEARECEIQAQQAKELLETELETVKNQLKVVEETCVAERRAKEEASESLGRAQAEITELRNTTGRLQLELKCALNENELYEYRLAEARHMSRVQSSEQRAALGNEASLRSDSSGSVSSGTDRLGTRLEGNHSESINPPMRSRCLEPSAVLPTALGSTVSTGIGGSLPIIHPSQAPPIGKYGGNSDDETFEEWHEQFELVSAACGWSDRLKLANLSTRLHGQAYAFYRTCTSQQTSDYSELVAALKQIFAPVRIQSVQSELFHSRKQQVQEKVDEYAQDLSRLYQKAYPRALQGTGETETMGKTVLAYQFVAGLLPNIRAKIAGTEGTFEQLWVKARYEEAKARDLEPKSTMGYSTNHRPPVVKEDGQMQPQSQPNQNAATLTRKCWLCRQTGHIAKACPQQRRGQPVEAPARQSQNTRHTTSCVTGKVNLPDVEAALNQKTATMHVLQPKEKGTGPTLGPAVTVELNLEGKPW